MKKDTAARVKEKKSSDEDSESFEEERREEVVQHEANYDPREEDADLEAARKHRSGK